MQDKLTDLNEKGYTISINLIGCNLLGFISLKLISST